MIYMLSNIIANIIQNAAVLRLYYTQLTITSRFRDGLTHTWHCIAKAIVQTKKAIARKFSSKQVKDNVQSQSLSLLLCPVVMLEKTFFFLQFMLLFRHTAQWHCIMHVRAIKASFPAHQMQRYPLWMNE